MPRTLTWRSLGIATVFAVLASLVLSIPVHADSIAQLHFYDTASGIELGGPPWIFTVNHTYDIQTATPAGAGRVDVDVGATLGTYWQYTGWTNISDYVPAGGSVSCGFVGSRYSCNASGGAIIYSVSYRLKALSPPAAATAVGRSASPTGLDQRAYTMVFGR